MEELIPVIAIIFGTGLTAYIFGKIFGLIRFWLEGRSGSGVSREEYNRLGKAFMQHKKEVEDRLQDLESAALKESRSAGQLNRPSIEVEDPEDDEERSSSGNRNLRNMLRE